MALERARPRRGVPTPLLPLRLRLLLGNSKGGTRADTGTNVAAAVIGAGPCLACCEASISALELCCCCCAAAASTSSASCRDTAR